jgi:DNA replication and repair protein RecF
MRLDRLIIEDLRRFERVELSLAPGLNLFTGGNGAGKTSILEAVYLLAYGRSFRAAVRDGLIRRGARALNVYGELLDDRGGRHALGLERGVRDWRARLDGEELGQLAELYRHIAVICFEPGSHALIAGGSELRRRFLDWGLFHVEPEFLPAWRAAQRALRQRNALLKADGVDEATFDAWESELAYAGERLTAQRRSYLSRWSGQLSHFATRLLPEAGAVQARFSPGWSGGADLIEALAASRQRDRALGHTTVGPHRADWSLHYDELPARETFSRGQEKLTALACVLAQGEDYATMRGAWPIVCLDDLGSELDRPHLQMALDTLLDRPAQLLLTGTEAPPGVAELASQAGVFHVEQGRVTPLL